MMIKRLLSWLIVSVLLASTVQAETRLKMSTTTSTQDSGLLKVLLPPFEKANSCKKVNLPRAWPWVWS